MPASDDSTGGFWQLLLAAETNPTKGRALIAALGPDCCDPAVFAAHPSLTAGEASRVLASRAEAWERAHAAGVRVLAGLARPSRLDELESTPLAMFVEGDPSCLEQPCVAIVGTRNASTYGRLTAKRFAHELASAGATIVSGGAYGIDTAAHEGALKAGGRTAVVLGGGIDRPYPPSNAGLFRRVAGSGGCVLSAYACGTDVDRHKFLERNDVIAALADAVLVIEAPDRSGSLRTAATAKLLGRPVFVVPANIEAEGFRGSHRLIREGAILADSPAVLTEAIDLEAGANSIPAQLEGLPGAILHQLTTTPQSAEKLAEALGLEPSELLSELTLLELDGRVARDLGGYALVP